MLSPRTAARLRAWPRKYLWQAPRGWWFKLTRNSNRRLQGLVEGRSVAIVGNARSLLATQSGDEIDRNDIIIRLNKGFVIDPLAQGRRTDMVGLTPELTEEETTARFQPGHFLMLIPKMRHYAFRRPDSIAKTLFYPWRWWFADRNLIGRRPSSGFMMISWLVRLGAARQITLYGFDFGQSGTYYNPANYKTPHNFAREGEIIQRWAKAGRLTIVSPPDRSTSTVYSA